MLVIDPRLELRFPFLTTDLIYMFKEPQYKFQHYKPIHNLLPTIFAKDWSLVKSRLALGSPGWLFVRSVVCHHAKNGPIHMKMVVDCPIVITSIDDTLLLTRSDQD